MITGGDFRRMITGAYRTFLREYEAINSLNVFPVPDGDTGTNMMLTLGAVTRVLAQASESEIGALSKRAADGAIMGARGNSGVILSQIFRGIARGLRGKNEATSSELGKAFQYGILYAYRAVARPVEGTILTVAKGIAKGARRTVRESVPFSEILAAAIDAGKAELARTPELLPILKSAGVVDAGGQGLIAFLSGCLDGINGIDSAPEASFSQMLKTHSQEKVEISHPYCTEFIVDPCSQTTQAAKTILEPLGESLILAGGDSLLKVHIHTARPGTVLESAITWGTLHDIKIDNMADQHEHVVQLTDETLAKTAVICVAAGKGQAEIMRRLGAVGIVSGGDTMNPAVEEFLAAIHAAKAEHFIILPNNKNVVLAAAQTQKLMGDSVTVLPSVNIPQAIAALTAFDPDKSHVANLAIMTQRMHSVKAASLTIAVRDSRADGHSVTAGRFIGLLEGKVVTDAEDIDTALSELLAKIISPQTEVISLYYGIDVNSSEAKRLQALLTQKFSGVQVEIYHGGQPHYHFIISVE
jgi:DAK2 domain fusion protein YloV